MHKTSAYYTQLSTSIADQLKRKWEKDIISAETRRLQDPKAMDIFGTKNTIVVSGTARVESLQAIVGPKWLGLALSIEELQ